MSKDLSMSMEDQELTALEIMVRGEDLLSVGAWEAPVRRLAMKGEALMVPNVNPPRYRITEKGEIRFNGEEMKLPSIMRVAAREPDPMWIVHTVGQNPESVVLLHQAPLSASGYEAITGGRRVPVEIGKQNDPGTAWMRGSKDEIDAFFQAMLDVAWSRGLRPKE